jgi:hypothetical protein
MNENGSLTLPQRKLVQKEIATEYRAWKKKLRRDPDENERRQIIAVGFEIARRKNKRIPAANPDIASALVAGAMGAVVNKVMSNPLDMGEVDRLFGHMESDLRAAALEIDRGHNANAADWLGRVWKTYIIINGYADALDGNRKAVLSERMERFKHLRGEVNYSKNPLVELGPLHALGPAAAVPMVNASGPLHEATRYLSGIGVSLTHREGEYRVNFKGGTEDTAYYTNDLKDAVGTGIEMVKRKGVYGANPGHTTTKCCVVCGKSYPYSWPWLSWEGHDICCQRCFAGAQENPTGVAFSGAKYYRPAQRIGGRIVRRRYRIMPEMPPIAGAHQEERRTHPVRRNPLLMTVMGANPAGPMPTDPGEAYHAAPEAHEAELSEMSQLSRFRGLRHAGLAPTTTRCYAGVSVPGEPDRVTRLRQIAAGGISRCANCFPPSDEELEAGEWIRAGKKKHEDAPCAECVNRTVFEGAPLDPMSASVIVQTYDALTPAHKEKFARLPLSMMDKMIGDWFLHKTHRAVLIGFILRASGGVMANPPPKTRLRSIHAAMTNPKLAAKLNPGKRRKVTMSLEQFAEMVKKQGDPKMWANFCSKVKGYQKWTHGSMPKKVTLETVDVPGVTGMWITYDMGREPEKLYTMPANSKRKGAWRHPWEKMPHLKGDPQAGIMITKTVAGNKITDFLHG